MPPLPAVPNVAKVVFNGTAGGRGVANIFHVQGDFSAATPANAASLAASLRGLWVTRMIPLLNAAYVLTHVDVTVLSAPDAPQGTSSGSTPGSLAGTAAPLNCAMVLSWSSPFRYRGGHPRTYLCGLNQSQISSDARTFLASAVTAAAAAAAGFRSDVAALTPSGVASWDGLCVVHYYTPGGSVTKPPSFKSPPTTSVIQGSTVHNRVDTQRRRLGKES